MYEDKQPWYFNFVRRDIEALLPQRAERTLEIGCAAGATLAWLRDSGRVGHTTGIELMAEAAAVARGRVDRVLEGPVESQMAALDPAGYDLVLCLDVLEHLVDPWQVMQQLRTLVRPGGVVIVSLPNVRNHRVVLPLLLSGRFEYKEAGIMDRTHLRFFSRQGALDLLAQAGLKLTAEAATGTRRGDRDFWRNLLTGGLLAPLFVHQHLLRGTRLGA
ncbi:class I SAM-dependent methyltransferase [Paucibacter sp. AS339]|uniref:class I SAM-dependent methyltransferase n=1 Tax=Paucibacter hankyongi TaxID=3133434 RepID=UPI0030B6A290